MTIRSAILQLLDERDLHGYQLKVDFESRTGGLWPLNVGQVYTTLDRLRRDGRVTEVEAEVEGQRTYSITEDGRREVKEWLATTRAESSPPRDELVMKVLLALGRSPADATAVIDEQRTGLLATLQEGRRRQRQRATGIPRAERLANDAVLTRIEADLAWLDRCEADARGGAAATPPDRHHTDRGSTA